MVRKNRGIYGFLGTSWVLITMAPRKQWCETNHGPQFGTVRVISNAAKRLPPCFWIVCGPGWGQGEGEGYRVRVRDRGWANGSTLARTILIPPSEALHSSRIECPQSTPVISIRLIFLNNTSVKPASPVAWQAILVPTKSISRVHLSPSAHTRRDFPCIKI